MCTSQLVQHLYNVLRMLESGNAVDVVHLDTSKAFDKFYLGFLLLKLRSIGIVDLLLRWIRFFLMGRFQWVVVKDYC